MLIFTLIEAMMVLTPQPVALLAATLMAANLAIIWIPIKNTYLYAYKNRVVGRRGGWLIWRGVAYLLALATGLLGAVLTFLSPNVGLYLVTASYGAILAIVTLNSWSIMLGIGLMDKKHRRPKRRDA